RSSVISTRVTTAPATRGSRRSRAMALASSSRTRPATRTARFTPPAGAARPAAPGKGGVLRATFVLVIFALVAFGPVVFIVLAEIELLDPAAHAAAAGAEGHDLARAVGEHGVRQAAGHRDHAAEHLFAHFGVLRDDRDAQRRPLELVVMVDLGDGY